MIDGRWQVREELELRNCCSRSWMRSSASTRSAEGWRPRQQIWSRYVARASADVDGAAMWKIASSSSCRLAMATSLREMSELLSFALLCEIHPLGPQRNLKKSR